MKDIIKHIFSALPQWMSSRLFGLIFTIRAAGLLLAALALWGFAQIADEVLDKESQFIDTAILLALQRLHTPLLDQVMTGITFFGEPELLLIICLGFAAWLLLRGNRSQATTLGIASLGAVGLNYLLKDLFARDRPALWDRIVDVRYYSFPSGHAMISMVVYGAIAYLLIKNFGKWSNLIIITTVALIFSIGLSRLYLGVHWPTDVLAGYAAGIVWLMTCIFSLEFWQYRQVSNSNTVAPSE
ncbi:phosphatase PAP2 family protein [Funiculus sociatus GB2-C1]|uniref:phosphatase PAP2 family protein n=2 Tax=Cyanophyceae TaxID=3028117 RepID=UPI0028C48BFF|nr:phosphatase PAP2 family protein [Trichocoleus sp. FACHB-69]